MIGNDKITLFNGFILDRMRGCLLHDGQPVHLRPGSYRVLEYLVENGGRLISKDALINAVWEGRAVTDGAVGKCIEELRVVFGEEGRRYLRNVRGRGYIFDPEEQGDIRATESQEIDMVRVIVEERNDDVQSAVQIKDARSHWGSVPTLLAVTLALLAVSFGLYWFSVNRHVSTNITRIAVLPLKNESGNSDVDYLTDGMTESLINSLSRLPGLAVKSRGSVFQYKGKDVDARKIASDLSVQAVLTGRFVQRGDDVTLYLSLVDGQTGNQIWGEKYDRNLNQLARLERDTATDIARQLNSRLGIKDQKRLEGGSTENSEAYLTYLKGRYYWYDRGGYQKSREFFQKAIELDPTYSLGYAGLAHYYGYAAAVGMVPPDENWQRSEAAIKKALELDDSLAESYNALAGVQLYYHHDWTAAEESFKRGLDLNPDSAEVRHHYGRCLMLFGRNEEAVAQMKRTLELEPLAVRYNFNAGRMYLVFGQYSEAINHLNNALELDANSAAAADVLGLVYERMGNDKAAIAEWSRVLSLTGKPEQAEKLQAIYNRSGLAAAIRWRAELQLKDLEERAKRSEYVPPGDYATAYMRIGDKEKAFMWLEKATEVHDRFALEFTIDPLFESLRSDPRFQRLADRVKVF